MANSGDLVLRAHRNEDHFATVLFLELNCFLHGEFCIGIDDERSTFGGHFPIATERDERFGVDGLLHANCYLHALTPSLICWTGVLERVRFLHFISNDLALDLVRTADDSERLRIAVVALDRVFLAESIAAMDLHRIGCRRLSCFGAVDLCRCHALLHIARISDERLDRVIKNALRSCHGNAHVCEFERDTLEIDDCLAELLAGIGIRCRSNEACRARLQRARCAHG